MTSAGNPNGSPAPAWYVNPIVGGFDPHLDRQIQQQPLNQSVKDLIDRAVPELLEMYEGEDNKYVA
jgi:hypothetical protein